jgi:ferric-dicitrate binding protein FerR (iron transport regulator)
MMPISPEDFDPLCAQFLDGTLSEEDRDRFVAMLESDPAKVAELRSQLRVSGALARMRPELSDETFLHAVLPHLGAVGGEGGEVFHNRVMNTIRLSRFRRTALAAAAVVTLAGSLVLMWPRGSTAEGEVVARVFQGAEGSEESRPVRIGEKFEFSTGVSRMEFANGAVVAIEAPASLRIRSAVEVALDRGRLNAWCPETAHGFRVVTTSATLTDLGTSFGVSAATDGSADFVVLDGKVEVEKDGEVRTLQQGGALRASRGKGMREVAFEPSPFRRTWPVASGIRTTRGEVLPAPPGTPQTLAAMENDEHILVIPERRDFSPDTTIRADIVEPGVYMSANLNVPVDFQASPETKVRSYLLRYNPVGTQKRYTKRFEGSVTFDRPVLAIITASRALNRSDKVLTKAPLPPLGAKDAELRGLERGHPMNASDRVSLSADRLTVTVTFYAGESIDEIRAITADD